MQNILSFKIFAISLSQKVKAIVNLTLTTMNKTITIIATNRIGCEETISLILDENSKTFKRLKKASDEGCIRDELSYMEEETYNTLYSNYRYPYFSLHQLRRLHDFECVIQNKFYNYNLSLQIK